MSSDMVQVKAEALEHMGSISRYQVTAVLIVVAASPAEAAGAVLEALGGLMTS